MNQELTAKGSTTSYATGTICPKTGSYKSSNKYMDAIVLVIKGAKFPTGLDGGKTYWTALSTSTDGSKESFTSVKVTAGAA